MIALIDLAPDAFSLVSAPPLQCRVRVVTCEVYTAFGTVFMHSEQNHRSQWHSKNKRPTLFIALRDLVLLGQVDADVRAGHDLLEDGVH